MLNYQKYIKSVDYKISQEGFKEIIFGKSIFLETYVKVDKDWRSNKRELDSFGYNPE